MNIELPAPTWRALSPARRTLRLQHLRSEIAAQGRLGRRRARRLAPRARAALVLAAVVIVGALAVVPIGGASVASRAIDGISALWSSASHPPADPESAQNLGEAVSRWNAEASDPAHAPGTPLLGATRDLVTGLGSAGDTITVFPTRNGAVCYEIRAAGSCGRLGNGVGVVFGILYTRDGGTRIFGVAADNVREISVVVDGVPHRALIKNNAFYYQLPRHKRGADIDELVARWEDGSDHPFHVHG
jgi:hypothetical protein